ncbi:MAG: hypothetical protein EXR77_18880 [Myxococcales bacterium]|nr:hypothetical protein [Myxococcales bacterium]
MTHRPALTSMLWLAWVLLGVACDNSEPPDLLKHATFPTVTLAPPDPPPPNQTKLRPWQDCQASDQAWVRRALLAIGGRRPWGQGEVLVWTDAVAAIRRKQGYTSNDGAFTGGEMPWGPGLWQARREVALAMAQLPSFRLRWTDFVLDALRVNRIETKSQLKCYTQPGDGFHDKGELAQFVRDHTPTSAEPTMANFTLGQLVSSALKLDDVSVIWRANLFALVAKPFEAANVGANELERSRRQDFGRVFDAAYLHRDFVCMNCHNSQFSTTYDPQAQLNRAWPVFGHFEKALFGSPTGKHPADQEASKGASDLRAHAVLRHGGVVDNKSGQSPWGWHKDCGRFKRPTEPDPLGHDGYFGLARGATVSVYDLETSLHKGINHIVTQGLIRKEDDSVDPDDALAWLTAQSIVEQVWTEVIGSPLTVANYFPRTESQRDTLERLTDRFVRNRFSLRHLLADISVDPVFNPALPDVGCGDSAYPQPRLVNPWSNHESDPDARGNGPGDAVMALPARQLRRSLHIALGWPQPMEYPAGEEQSFQLQAGVFLKDAEPGFRSLDFAGRLAWEQRYGQCPRPNAFDFIDLVAELASGAPNGSWQDAVALLKDRLVGEPFVTQTEVTAMQALIGAKMTDKVVGADAAERLRRVCGVLVTSPQFLLAGVVAPDRQSMPVLTPASVNYANQCLEMQAAFAAAKSPWVLNCAGAQVQAAQP